MIRFTLLLIVLLPATVRAANWPAHPQLRAVRATTAPVIDGRLDEAAWQNAPEFTDFTQQDPDDTMPATLRTSVRILYDDEAIYFGARMFDTHPPTAQLVRRDNFTQSDFIAFNLDPQLDRLSGNAFIVFPANVQVDTVMFNDIGEDSSWDGVWESSAQVVADGWVAEVRVPFSQLRFPDRDVHVWGINITRRTVRNNELVRVVNTPKGQTGFVSHFADIIGIDGIRRGRALELVPYMLGRSDLRTRFNVPTDRHDSRGDGGLDLKYALTSSLTLTGTINPDFGQVEVDPAEVNLSQFETFYPEKRPFFTEGLNNFRFADSPAPSRFNFIFPPSLFYTRRIGRDVDGTDARIFAASKLTGNLPGGWSIGVLDALTGAADGTNYFVARGTKEIGDGSRAGFIATSVNGRDVRSAATAGVDAYTSFRDKSWILEGSLIGSRIRGSGAEITAAQRSPSRYYQRPDATHVRFDPSRTSLTGWGGRAMLSKVTGLWQMNMQVQGYSPGLETNDTGFMRRTDIISAHAVTRYINQVAGRRTRQRNLLFATWHNRNFDGDTLDRSLLTRGFVTFRNYMRLRGGAAWSPGAFDDRLTRGGPVARTPSRWRSDFGFETDDRKKYSLEVNVDVEGAADGSYGRALGLELTARPASNLEVQVEPSLSRSHDFAQYVTTTTDGRYVFAELEQHTFEIGMRADWTLTSRLSFQLYMQPFISAGDYHDYRELAAPRTRDYIRTTEPLSPDFNFRSVRGSAVVRWEFRPGSALFVAWNENRAGEAAIGDFRFGRDLRAIPGSPSLDVFLIKVSYWLPL